MWPNISHSDVSCFQVASIITYGILPKKLYHIVIEVQKFVSPMWVGTHAWSRMTHCIFYSFVRDCEGQQKFSCDRAWIGTNLMWAGCVIPCYCNPVQSRYFWLMRAYYINYFDLWPQWKLMYRRLNGYVSALLCIVWNAVIKQVMDLILLITFVSFSIFQKCRAL